MVFKYRKKQSKTKTGAVAVRKYKASERAIQDVVRKVKL